jgi:hypothetical protein
MQLSQFVNALQSDLTAVAAVGGDETAEAARRISVALEGSVSLRLVDVLAAAALELNAQIPGGRVEVRLSGRDPQLVFVEDEHEAPVPGGGGGEDAYSARITLRLPEALKASVEASASSEGVSTNTWLVRAISRALNPPTRRGPGTRLTGFARS